MIKLLSIDLSNFCSKECPFCYNHSHKDGNVMWTPTEAIEFTKDCIANGVEAVSLGGGEPFEFDGVFEIIDQLQPLAYVSVTTNGLPLEDNSLWNEAIKHSPDKIHFTIHNPGDSCEVDRVIRQIQRLSATHIKPGVNLLVSDNLLEECRDTYHRLRADLHVSQIILVPRRFSHTPTPRQLAYITNKEPFQSASCLLGCKPPTNFASVSWDKKVNLCSYAVGKQPMNTLDYAGLQEARIPLLPIALTLHFKCLISGLGLRGRHCLRGSPGLCIRCGWGRR